MSSEDTTDGSYDPKLPKYFSAEQVVTRIQRLLITVTFRIMLSEVLGYVGNHPNQVAYSHYEMGNEILMQNIVGQLFYCQRLHNVTNVKSNRVLAVTQMQIIEMAVNPFKNGFGTVLEVHDLEGLTKVKFKKTSSGVLTLTFTGSNVLQYVMTDPTSCVDYIKVKMQLIGMRGDLTKSVLHTKHIETANSFFEATKEIEAQFSLNPSYKLIEKIMDLLREAVEQFAEGSDDRYMSVIKHIQIFLQRADVTEVLDSGPINRVGNISMDDRSLFAAGQPAIDIEEAVESITYESSCSLVDAQRSAHGGSTIPQLDAVDQDEISKFEEELAELISSPFETTATTGCAVGVSDDLTGLSDAEVELKLMLGDITEEFTTLLNSFEKSSTDNVGGAITNGGYADVENSIT